MPYVRCALQAATKSQDLRAKRGSLRHPQPLNVREPAGKYTAYAVEIRSSDGPALLASAFRLQRTAEGQLADAYWVPARRCPGRHVSG